MSYTKELLVASPFRGTNLLEMKSIGRIKTDSEGLVKIEDAFKDLVNSLEKSQPALDLPNIYVMYSEYKRDGTYDCKVGVNTLVMNNGFCLNSAITVQEVMDSQEKYMLYTVSVDKPEELYDEVLETWGQVWCDADAGKFTRAFNKDFDVYISPVCCQIFVSIL